MTTPPAGPQASELLAVPLVTDDDVLERVAAIIDPAARQQRTLWLFFLERAGKQANLVVPIDNIPPRLEAADIGNLCYVAREAIAHNPVLASVIVTLSRPGTLRRTDDDRHLLRGLQHGAARHGTPLRMLCLATPEGVRELGPVRPERRLPPRGGQPDSGGTQDHWRP
jgi:hypothetical protein